MLAAVYHCLFVLILSSATYRLSTASPTGARNTLVRLDENTCRGLARSLLWNVTEALAVDSLFRGLNCTEQSAELYIKTHTLSVCVPQQSKCTESTSFTFDQDECLLRIMEDLTYYRRTFKSYIEPNYILENLVIRSIDNLMQNCFYKTLLDGSQPVTYVEQENSFDGRLKLCKILKGFQARTVTINRVLNHILTTTTKS